MEKKMTFAKVERGNADFFFFSFHRENEMAKAAASNTYELRGLIFVTPFVGFKDSGSLIDRLSNKDSAQQTTLQTTCNSWVGSNI